MDSWPSQPRMSQGGSPWRIKTHGALGLELCHQSKCQITCSFCLTCRQIWHVLRNWWYCCITSHVVFVWSSIVKHLLKLCCISWPRLPRVHILSWLLWIWVLVENWGGVRTCQDRTNCGNLWELGVAPLLMAIHLDPWFHIWRPILHVIYLWDDQCFGRQQWHGVERKYGMFFSCQGHRKDFRESDGIVATDE